MQHWWNIWLWSISHYIHCSSSKMKNFCQTWPWLFSPFNLDIRFYGREMGENKIGIPFQPLPCAPGLSCLVQAQQLWWISQTSPSCRSSPQAALKTRCTALTISDHGQRGQDIETNVGCPLPLVEDNIPVNWRGYCYATPRLSKAGRQRAAEEMGRPESTCALLPQTQIFNSNTNTAHKQTPEANKTKKLESLYFSADRILSIKLILKSINENRSTSPQLFWYCR